jgi:antitoxin MazE
MLYIVETHRSNFMHAQIGKWGSSLAVRIPGTYAKDLGLKHGMDPDVSLVDGGILLLPHPKQNSIEELVSRITPENTNEETSWGEALGRETW